MTTCCTSKNHGGFHRPETPPIESATPCRHGQSLVPSRYHAPPLARPHALGRNEHSQTRPTRGTTTCGIRGFARPTTPCALSPRRTRTLPTHHCQNQNPPPFGVARQQEVDSQQHRQPAHKFREEILDRLPDSHAQDATVLLQCPHRARCQQTYESTRHCPKTTHQYLQSLHPSHRSGLVGVDIQRAIHLSATIRHPSALATATKCRLRRRRFC